MTLGRDSSESGRQCVQEGWADKLREQSNEGCNVAGLVRVNKVVGNIQLSPGRSFRTGSQNIYELVPYLKDDGNRHDFSHTIYELAVAADDDFNFAKASHGKRLKQHLGIEANPLDGTTLRVSQLRIYHAKAFY